MTGAFIILPIHLFKNIDAISKLKIKKIIMIEEPRFFTDYKFHKLKLAYHRATMKYYYDYLKKSKFNVLYYEYNEVNKSLYNKLLQTYDNIYYYESFDDVIETRMTKYKFIKVETLNFLISRQLCDENKNLFYKNGKYNFMNFYKFQRKRLNILVDKNDEPIEGKWTFDIENRKKLPKDITLENQKIYDNKYIKEAIKYVNKHFKNNYGSLDYFIYPVTHKESEAHLKYFLDNKLNNFGTYEDAISKDNNFIYHSLISPMLNVGLLTDTIVITQTMKYIKKTTIENFEGFIRQIIGWRNYCVVVYLYDNKKMEEMNFFNATQKLPIEKFWTAKTNMKPVDDAINNIIKYSYSHHIIRLMVLGNFMLLCGFKPMDIYNIYMEWFIDSYDVFMKLNIFAMSQHSVKNLALTKPYFSSSNYIIKMSDYSPKDNWRITFDALFYNFINKHKNYLKKNYGYSRLVALWNKKTNREKKLIVDLANLFIKKLCIK